jgi:hypothetical protein
LAANFLGVGAGDGDLRVDLQTLTLEHVLAVVTVRHVDADEVAGLHLAVHDGQLALLRRDLLDDPLELRVRDLRGPARGLDPAHLLELELRADVDLDLVREVLVGLELAELPVELRVADDRELLVRDRLAEGLGHQGLPCLVEDLRAELLLEDAARHVTRRKPFMLACCRIW